MNDYEELIRNLREDADAVQSIELDIPICTKNHILEVADAIETLAKGIKELKNAKRNTWKYLR